MNNRYEQQVRTTGTNNRYEQQVRTTGTNNRHEQQARTTGTNKCNFLFAFTAFSISS
jgi:hypothetical protein